MTAYLSGDKLLNSLFPLRLPFLFNIPRKGHVRHYRCITALCVVFKGSANGSSVRDDRLMRLTQIYFVLSAAPRGSVRVECNQRFSSVQTGRCTCVHMRTNKTTMCAQSACETHVHARRRQARRGAFRLPLHRQNCSGGSCMRQRRVIKPSPLSMKYVKVYVCV